MDLGADTVTIVRPAPPDWRGDPSVIDPAETVVTGCSIQPASTSEQTDQRNTVVEGWIAFLPAGTDIVATDIVRWDGTDYRVDGEPGAWKDLGAAAHHIEVKLRRVVG